MQQMLDGTEIYRLNDEGHKALLFDRFSDAIARLGTGQPGSILLELLAIGAEVEGACAEQNKPAD